MYSAMVMMCLGLSQGQFASPPSPPSPTPYSASPAPTVPPGSPGEPDYFNQRTFRFPLNALGRQADIREMRLYVSTDKGKSWQQRAVVSGEKDHIMFTAETDGHYWVQVAAVGLDGRQEPENIYNSPPEHIRKMVIDTLKPFIRIVSAQRHGDEIHVAWEIQEEHPDWSKFKVEYLVQPSPQWNEAAVEPGHIGKARIHAGPGTVIVRVRLRDKAGNVSAATAEVPGNGPFAQAPPGGLALTGGQEPPPPTFPPSDVPPAPTPAPTPAPYVPPSPEPRFPPAGPPAYTPPPSQPWTPGAAPTTTIHHHAGAKLVASTADTSSGPAPVTPACDKNLPSLQYVNSPEVTLEYELTKVGPSGVGSVDLWWTQNDGQTWEKYADDPHPKGQGRHQRTVELPGDGVYGFIIVVKSRAGMGRREPRSGDVPEMRIEVDTLPPIAQLFAPVADPQRSNSLILTWLAKDKNLSTHPITLEWSERREGPWQIIAANLPNTGRHSWQLPDQLPVQVYLRIKARDCAGNEGVATTPEPQMVDLSIPEGRLLDIRVRR